MYTTFSSFPSLQHQGQYGELLAESFEVVYKAIVALCRHKNKDLKLAAFDALESFLKEVGCGVVDGRLGDR